MAGERTIYMIASKNPHNNDIYIGHTDDYVKTKNQFKKDIRNLGCETAFIQYIRSNGGESNWSVFELETGVFTDTQVQEKHREYVGRLSPSLNRVEMNYHTAWTTELNCVNCDYRTNLQWKFDRHIQTAKHRKRTQTATEHFICDCGKTYKHKSTLYSHKKGCRYPPSEVQLVVSEPTQEGAELNTETMYHLLKECMISNKNAVELYKQNAELKQMLLAQQTQLTELSNKPVSITTTTNTTNNTQINIHMFLNEYCKDAMTISDFIKSIEPSIDEIMYMTKNGNKEGLFKILNSALGTMKITERPLHCTDLKRHTTYIKEHAGWTKEQDQKYMKKLCEQTEHACIKKSMEIITENSNYVKNGTREYEECIKMMVETNGGREGSEYNHGMVMKSLEEILHLDKTQISEAIQIV